MKKSAPKIALHRETLRRLQHETLVGAVGGGVTVVNSCTVTLCGHTCPTACHTCLC